MSSGIYIYGIIQSGESQEFGDIGIGDQASTVQTIGFRDIAAVISESPLAVYDSLAKEKTIKDLITHQFVIEKVMQRFTIVPVKFGTMVESAQDAVKFLENGYTLLCEELRKMEAKIELNVIVTWNLQKILTALYRGNSQVQQKQQEIAAKGAQASIEDKILLGKLIEQSLKAEKERYSELVLNTLEMQAAEVCLHDLTGDEMIVNAAFLLDKRDEERFTEMVALLDSQFEGAFNFRVVGPLPVYSFSTILLERIDSARFEEAKKVFGLDGEITAKAVRDTYRQLARASHPDKKQGATSFHVINAAYRTLKEFTEKGPVHVGVYHWEKDAQ